MRFCVALIMPRLYRETLLFVPICRPKYVVPAALIAFRNDVRDCPTSIALRISDITPFRISDIIKLLHINYSLEFTYDRVSSYFVVYVF